MVGNSRKNDKGERTTHNDLLDNSDVGRWFGNLEAKSRLTAQVYLRGLGFYCDRMNTTPEKIIRDAQAIKPLQGQFLDFVRGMEKEGKAGSYIARYKKVIHSWTKFNSVEFKTIANIKGESISPRTENESVPTQEELAKILRYASARGRTEIALMAYSGLRPRSMSNDNGSECLKLSDIPELTLENGKVSFTNSPIQIKVKALLNKGQKHGYFTFLGDEGATYLREYLETRISDGETLEPDSPVLQYDRNVQRKHIYIPTFYIEREIREAIRGAGLKKRPYVLRAYFATAMDISEQKGLISHPWRQFFMGHAGDMEARYSTNKNQLESVVEEMRSAYKACLKYIETNFKEDNDTVYKKATITAMESAFDLSLKEEQRQELMTVPLPEFKELIKEIFRGKNEAKAENRIQHKVVPENELMTYLDDGWEIVQLYPTGDKAIIKSPNN